jgi:hypothetical protein
VISRTRRSSELRLASIATFLKEYVARKDQVWLGLDLLVRFIFVALCILSGRKTAALG